MAWRLLVQSPTVDMKNVRRLDDTDDANENGCHSIGSIAGTEIVEHQYMSSTIINTTFYPVITAWISRESCRNREKYNVISKRSN